MFMYSLEIIPYFPSWTYWASDYGNWYLENIYWAYINKKTKQIQKLNNMIYGDYDISWETDNLKSELLFIEK